MNGEKWRTFRKLNPAYKEATIELAIQTSEGKLIKDPYPLRWANVSDADHDFDRMAKGLQPEKYVPFEIEYTVPYL